MFFAIATASLSLFEIIIAQVYACPYISFSFALYIYVLMKNSTPLRLLYAGFFALLCSWVYGLLASHVLLILGSLWLLVRVMQRFFLFGYGACILASWCGACAYSWVIGAPWTVPGILGILCVLLGVEYFFDV